MSEELDRDELVRLLKESKLVAPGEIERVAEAQRDATGSSLARFYVDAGLLTQFQMDAILAGTTADLHIGNYDVLDRLGAGGMGTVFKARHRRMKRIVALKVLSKSLKKDPTFVKRFQREVETIAKLNHPNIVMAYDADEADIGHFLVMEFVDGQDLANVVQKQGAMSVRGAVEAILHAARGLACAHAQKIVHRDIKPANLLLGANGIVKVADLGLARLTAGAVGAETTASSVTQAGTVMGTADFMSPEQAVDTSAIDQRADIYSLGATLYFLLTGSGPYSATSLMVILLKHRDAPIPSLRETRKDVPPALDDLFRHMLAKAPGDRPQDMTQVAASLEAILTGLSAAPAPAKSTAAPNAELPTDASQALDVTVFKRAPAPEKRVETGLPAAEDTLSVMLVEPSRAQAGIIRKYLQSLGLVNIVSTNSGGEALKLMPSHRLDVVITAMHLSDMTGTQLAQQIRADKSRASPGFVLISSESEGKEAAALGYSGHAALLHKPFTAESLMHALKVANPAFGRLQLQTDPTRVMPAPLPATRSQSRVLLVDDSAAARLHIRGVLATLGLTQVTEADDGAQAVAFLTREKFDLIITDYNMPLMDGRGLIAYMKQNAATASVPIIMVTTESDPSRLEAVRNLGVTICEKSFPIDVARTLINSLLRG